MQKKKKKQFKRRYIIQFICTEKKNHLIFQSMGRRDIKKKKSKKNLQVNVE